MVRFSPFQQIYNSLSHLSEILFQELPLLTSWRHVDLQNVRFAILVQNNIEPKHFEAFLFVVHLGFAALNGFQYVQVDFLLHLLPLADLLLQLRLLHDGVRHAFAFEMHFFWMVPLSDEVLFVLRVVGEVFVHVLVILVAVSITAKASIALFERVNFQRVKTFY
jgi:hypothetical protein